MPASNRQPVMQAATPAPKAPTAKSKYTNKDGTKTITVPKSSSSTPPAQPSPTTTSSSKGGAPTNMSASPAPAQADSAPSQKRRAKLAAKAAAAQEAAEADDVHAPNGLPSPASTNSAPLPQAPATGSPHAKSRHHRPQPAPTSHELSGESNNPEYWDDETESDEEHHLHSYNGGSISGRLHANGSEVKSKKSKKKKKQKITSPVNVMANELERRSSGISREKIWNTSSQEERERIKQFWLGLGEDERKSLVKVEKDAVLKKMKEQQKHTCSCTVCGRKRTAIEEELEGLYDAYYEELESFANQPHHHPDGPPMLGNPTRRIDQMAGLVPPRGLPSSYSNHHPSRGRIVEHVDHDEDEDDDDIDEYSDEDDLEDDEDDEPEPEDLPQETSHDAQDALSFFNFGQSLTVQGMTSFLCCSSKAKYLEVTILGGILTVADDLLKNDGRKFIEMMEQLAERRMAREEDARDHYAGAYGHSVNGAPIPNSHNHPPPDDEEYDEEDEEEDDYESGEEEYDEEEDTMTEEQRMEEGRRMFQIFAARMFEQRVLTAYKEKVAKERQQKLLEELEDESRAESQRKAKKAKEAQKRKDKAAQKKQALAEEKARKEAEKAAEEAQRLADAQRRQDEAKAKAEEKRRKKELQKKAEEEERLRKEAERQRRAHEVKERQAEQERKAREVKEREKKLKHEQSVKEKEARELKERETRERREKHERDKREKEQRAAQAKADRDAKEKQKQEEKAAQKAAALAVPVPTAPAKKHHAVSAVPALPQHPPASHPSPHIAVATPVLPKAPTPMKPRSTSQEVTRSMSQASISGSGASQSVSPHNQTPLQSSPGPNGSLNKTPTTGPPGFGPHGTPTSPLHSGIKSPPGLGQGPYLAGMPPMGMHHPPGLPPMGPGFSPLHNPGFPLMGGNFRPHPGTMPLPPPGFGSPIGRGFPIPHAPPGFQHSESMSGLSHAFSLPSDIPPGQPSPHSRQASASFEPGSLDMRNSPQIQPISRPTPIGRPASIVHGQRSNDRFSLDEEISNHLGSSALLDDSDEPLGEPIPQRRSNTAAPGVRPPFTAAPFPEPVFGSSPLSHGWGGHLFSPPPGFGTSAWPPNPAFGGPPPGMRPAQPHSVAVRLMLCRACRELGNNAADAQGYIDLSALKGHVDSLNTGEAISQSELLDMCETEGNLQNGGGSFDVRQDEASGKVSVRFDPSSPGARNVGAPGEIGSPISGGLFGGR
ncbi:hypothetical protein PG999_005324 [Apiospora kogelbergensis]|uniref:Stress response protein NST1 n=1 Tax=Apiospora kogelbergensis TaxID=1337665 RepID=A0AAW0R1W0_9PEZI